MPEYELGGDIPEYTEAEPENGELQFIDGEEPDEEDVFSDDGTETDGEPEDYDNALPTDDGIDIGDVVP